MLAFEVLDFVTKNLGVWTGAKSIPVRGKHLDDLRTVDSLCIAFSKANTAPFTYLFCRYCWFADAVVWHWKEVSVLNFPLATLLLFLAFDVSYYILHWILHWQILYKWVHKHHHVQKAPSRGSVDAANVHPIEMILGEYNHILALWLVSTFAVRVHVAAALVFLVLGGVMAGVNHTRHDLTVTIAGIRLFDSKAHDVHHRIPQSNYGQYTMFWDHLFGTYRYVEQRSVGAGRSHTFLLLAARMIPMTESIPSPNSILGQGKRFRYPRLSSDSDRSLACPSLEPCIGIALVRSSCFTWDWVRGG